MKDALLDVLVIGGGVSGLAAARLLRARGLKVEVWEGSQEPGGWARSEPWGEGILEPGAQVLFRSPGSALDRLLLELDLPVEPLLGKRWMTMGDRAVELPGRSTQWMPSPLLSPVSRLRVGWGLLRTPAFKPGATLQDVARCRFGKTFTQDLLPGLTAGLFAAPPELLAGTLLPVLVGRASGTLVRPIGGMGSFVGALARNLPLHLNRPVRRLEILPEGGVRCVGEEGTLIAQKVVLALPAPAAADLLEPFVPKASGALRAIRFLDLRFRHSRHAACEKLSDGWGLLCDPGREAGLLGFTCLPGPGNTIQLRCGMGGAYPIGKALQAGDGLEKRLSTWFPTLSPALEECETLAVQAMPLPEPGHGLRVAEVLKHLPDPISWVGAGRFPGGIPGILSGLEQ